MEANVAVKTEWDIEFGCGHSETRDLSNKRADERAGYAKWLSSKDCTDCWRTTQSDGQERVSTDEWIRQQRAEEVAAVSEWEKLALMGDLSGSEKAVAYGRKCRHGVVSGAYESLVMSGDLDDDTWLETIERPARMIDKASWWIDNKDCAPGDVGEIVEAARSTPAVTSENDL
jgi:hypothetical protein